MTPIIDSKIVANGPRSNGPCREGHVRAPCRRYITFSSRHQPNHQWTPTLHCSNQDHVFETTPPKIENRNFYLSFWRSNFISCERVAFRGASLALPRALREKYKRRRDTMARGQRARRQEGKMWRWEDVMMRRCEDEKMWRWEYDNMWRWKDEKKRR